MHNSIDLDKAALGGKTFSKIFGRLRALEQPWTRDLCFRSPAFITNYKLYLCKPTFLMVWDHLKKYYKL